jgi:hypothetical protein
MSNVKKLMMSAAGGEVVNVEDVFNVSLYRSNGSSRTITNGIDLNSNGGLIWLKSRSGGGQDHWLYDSERSSYSKGLRTNNTNPEYGPATSPITSTSTTGFTISTYSEINTNTIDYVAHTFRKCKNFFDIVTYTGNQQNRTISHNLGSVPGMIIIKNYSGYDGWYVYHRELDATAPEDYHLELNATASRTDDNTVFNDTAPTATHFTVGTNQGVNNTGQTYVAYLFAHHDGTGTFGPTGDQDIIKCGSFNMSMSGDYDAYVDLGFEPDWVLTHDYAHSGNNWWMFDQERGWGFRNEGSGLSSSTGGKSMSLFANTNADEGTNYNYGGLENQGFRWASNFNYVDNNTKYVYVAIRRGPMGEVEDPDEVFTASYGNASGSQPPGWTGRSPNMVDASMDLNVGGGSTDNVTFGARPILHRYTDQMHYVDGPFFYSWAGMNYDHPFGFRDGSNGTSDLGYMWSRARGAFDIMHYHSQQTNQTIPHNLNGEIGMAWFMNHRYKRYVHVYARPLGANKYLYLNNNNAANTDTGIWQNTHPTDTNFYVGSNFSYNDNYHVWLFGNLDGVSKVGSYTGNGSSSTGQNIDCGFSNGIRFLMIKNTQSTGPWYFWDEANLATTNQPYWYIQNQSGLNQTDYIGTYNAGFNIKNGPDVNNTNVNYLFYAIAA